MLHQRSPTSSDFKLGRQSAKRLLNHREATEKRGQSQEKIADLERRVWDWNGYSSKELGDWMRDGLFEVAWMKADELGERQVASASTATKGSKSTSTTKAGGKKTKEQEKSKTKVKGKPADKEVDGPKERKLPTYKVYLCENMLLFFPIHPDLGNSSQLVLDEVIPLWDIASMNKKIIGESPRKGELYHSMLAAVRYLLGHIETQLEIRWNASGREKGIKIYSRLKLDEWYMEINARTRSRVVMGTGMGERYSGPM